MRFLNAIFLVSFVFLFFIIPSVFALNFGSSKVTIERVWTINSTTSGSINFNGSLVINNSNQKIVSITTMPNMTTVSSSDGQLRLLYKSTMMGAGSLVLRAIVVVESDYDTKIQGDSFPPSTGSLSTTNKTSFNSAIADQAKQLEDKNSSLQTIANLVNWVHGYVTYDLSYWGKASPATTVFDQKRGVCVEYTHLLISMARSLGFQTRYVSGYVLGNSWQSHAWAQIYVPNDGWLDADPTFGEVGILDSSHVAIEYGTDQSDVYDTLLSNNGASLSVNDSVSQTSITDNSKGATLSLAIDNSSAITSSSSSVFVNISNTRSSEYLFGTFDLFSDDKYFKRQNSIILLKPGELRNLSYPLDRSSFQSGYSYTLPFSGSFNDAKMNSTVTILKPQSGINPNGSSSSSSSGASSSCPIGFLLFVFLGIGIVVSNSKKYTKS
ncbi:transglutaminase domain-containing protein [Candidatus Micrarchaeota archaeon]|nr:transglutaminase domain-containing protein [Candidatus Micrarchaeota archaeon]